MDSDKKKNITRRNFIKGLTGATVCCACFSLDCENSELKIEDGKGKEYLAAACGTYCGACPAYIAKHSEDEQIKMKLQKRLPSGPMNAKIEGFVNYMNNQRCDGCLSGGMLAGHCQRCDIRLCAANKQTVTRCCDCEELPCHRITDLINQGDYSHRQEYLPNLEKIRQMGVQEWIKYEQERWRCRRCGLPISWYDAECAGCGEPRSEQLFPLPNTKIQSL